jgi:hypothetical protein
MLSQYPTTTRGQLDGRTTIENCILHVVFGALDVCQCCRRV